MDYLIVALTEKSVDAALFSFSGSQKQLKGAQSFELSPEYDLSQVAENIGAAIVGTPKIVLCIPPSRSAHRMVSLPLSDLRKVREVLPHHLQGDILSSPEELVFDALPAGDASFMALWVEKKYISSLLEIFRSTGCEPHHITTIPFACSYLPGLGDNDAIYDGTTLSILSEGRISMQASFNRDGNAGILTCLAAREISGGRMPNRLVLLGEAADMTFDAEKVPISVVKLELPDELGAVFKNEATFQKLAGLYAVASTCHDGKLADFRRGDLACSQGDAALRKKMFTTGALLTAAILLMFGYKILQYRSINADIVSLNSSISGVYKEIFPGRAKAVDELAEVKGEIRKLAGTGSSRSILDLLKAVADAKGSGVNALFEAEMDGVSLRIKGDAVSTKAAADFKIALGDLLSSAELGETKTRPDGAVSFVITGTLKEGR